MVSRRIKEPSRRPIIVPPNGWYCAIYTVIAVPTQTMELIIKPATDNHSAAATQSLPVALWLRSLSKSTLSAQRRGALSKETSATWESRNIGGKVAGLITVARATRPWTIADIADTFVCPGSPWRCARIRYVYFFDLLGDIPTRTCVRLDTCDLSLSTPWRTYLADS